MSRTVLFLCPHNAAKSVIATALFSREVAARGLGVVVDSAGTDPDARPAPHVVALLAEEGIDVSTHRPRLLRVEDVRNAWRVVSMGCDVSTLAPSHVTVERWGDVPATDQDLAGARRIIGERVIALAKAIEDAAAA